MSLPKYRDYKDSGTDWLREIPSDWELRPLGYFFRERKTTVSDMDYQALSVTKAGIVPQLETAAKTDNGDNRKLVKSGDFVINSRSDRKGAAGLSTLDGSVSLISTVLEPRGIHGRYVHYLLRSEAFQEEYYRFGTGIVADLWSTRYSAMKLITLPAPSATEQATIVDFLDRETAKIDALLAKQEQLIATLREDRTATITHAVTKGLDPSAEMKDSGVEWVGPVPANWDVARITRMFTVTLGKMLQPSPTSPADRLQPYIRAAHIPPTGFTTEGATEMWFSPREVRDLTLRRGDIAVVEGGMGGYGRCDLIPHDLEGWGFQNSINRLRTRGGNDSAYAKYALQIAREQGFMEALCSVSTMPHLTAEKLGAMRIPNPPLAEQREIVAFLDERCRINDDLIAKADEVIATLREYRSALITDAVTGKIDVRGAA